MTRFKSYRFMDHALAEARSLGIYGDTAMRLGRMLKRAAPHTSPLGNRRFQDFVFMVEDDLVVAVSRMDSPAEAA
jgi:hypothetical protein